MKKIIGIFLLLLILIVYIPEIKAEESPLDTEELKENSSKDIFENDIKKAYVSSFSDTYIVTPGDIINVSVFGEPELTQRELPVKCDGFISLHPVGEVKVAGFDTNQVRSILTEKLKIYFVNPIVSIYISNTHIPKFYIYGAVQSPGLYRHCQNNNAPATLASVISNAGGIKYNADLKNIQVSNAKTGKTRSYNLLELIKCGNPSHDIYLNSGDTVYVPNCKTNAQISDEDFLLISSSSIAPESFPVRVRGAVKKPGVHSLTSRSPGINTAIAHSEGFTIDANIKAIKVRRVTPAGNMTTIVVNPGENDLVLRPNDVICVLDKRRTILGKSVRFTEKLAKYLSRFGSAFNQWDYVFDSETDHNIYIK